MMEEENNQPTYDNAGVDSQVANPNVEQINNQPIIQDVISNPGTTQPGPALDSAPTPSPVSDQINSIPEGPTAPVVPITPVLGTEQPVEVITQLEKPKKSKKWLIIALVVLFVVIAGLVGGYFVLKMNADKAASDYKVSLKTYMAKVQDNLEIAKDDPITAQAAIDALEKPELPDVMLGTISTEYVDAESDSTAADTQLGKVDQQVDDYAVAYNLLQALKAFMEDMLKAPKLDNDVIAQEYASQGSLDNSSTVKALDYYIGVYGTLKKAVDVALAEVSDENKGFIQDLSDMMTAYAGAMTELKEGFMERNPAKMTLANEHTAETTQKYGYSSELEKSQTQEEMNAYISEKSDELDVVISDFDSYYSGL